MAHAQPKRKVPLAFVPTLHGGRLPTADYQLLEEFSSRYQVWLVTENPVQSALPECVEAWPAVGLRSLLLENSELRLFYRLRADLDGAWQVLGLALRYPGVVLHSGGSLLRALRALYLERGDTPDFALELGRLLGPRAQTAFERILLGLDGPDLEESSVLLASLADQSLALWTENRLAWEELEQLSSPNRRSFSPAALRLPKGTEKLGEHRFLTIFGDFLEVEAKKHIQAAVQLLEKRQTPLRLVQALLPGSTSIPGVEGIPVSRELLEKSLAVLAVPDGLFPELSRWLLSSLGEGVATLAPAFVGFPLEAAIPLQTWPRCSGELVRALDLLQKRHDFGSLLGRAGQRWAQGIPNSAAAARELFGILERCHYQKPRQLPILQVWQDVVGIRLAEIEALSLKPQGAELGPELQEAVNQLQTRSVHP